MPNVRLTTRGQGSKITLDLFNLVNITTFIITDLRIRPTNSEPKRSFIFEFLIDAKPYRVTIHLYDETFHARDLLGHLKRQEQDNEEDNKI